MAGLASMSALPMTIALVSCSWCAGSTTAAGRSRPTTGIRSHPARIGPERRRTRLDSSDVILCAITPRWLESDFCRLEFSYGAKRGKFILPVICEPTHVGSLPDGRCERCRRIDLTRNRLLDYLALKETLNQAAAQSESFTATESKAARGHPLAALTGRAALWLALGALLLIAIAAVWLWN